MMQGALGFTWKPKQRGSRKLAADESLTLILIPGRRGVLLSPRGFVFQHPIGPKYQFHSLA